MFAPGMIAGPRGELGVAQLLQLATDGGFIERDHKFVMKPLGQIGESPAYYPMDRRNWPAFDNIDRRLTPDIAQARTRAGRLTIQQAFGTTRVKPEHPIPNDLEPDATDPGRCARSAAIVYLGQCKKPPCLVCDLRRPRQSSQRCPIKIFPQADC